MSSLLNLEDELPHHRPLNYHHCQSFGSAQRTTSIYSYTATSLLRRDSINRCNTITMDRRQSSTDYRRKGSMGGAIAGAVIGGIVGEFMNENQRQKERGYDAYQGGPPAQSSGRRNSGYDSRYESVTRRTTYHRVTTEPARPQQPQRRGSLAKRVRFSEPGPSILKPSRPEPVPQRQRAIEMPRRPSQGINYGQPSALRPHGHWNPNGGGKNWGSQYGMQKF
ncbi:hypothetical protein GLAREA_01118 [Glarea lozoyensis ATCC 20868]|uniref:Uncharacterized protein n=1 Tax=Glarea lozoyensis (strain ATCC 20868 / MF5171) TaxID=1116229 RepID=S3DU70_GLAL2|nr:uncharacterized protein GLAREA_01118 [Glarea lozoyensis ATCC 20868]EPE29958.1 hypothetical protein GLAREA_01118 [Glarea lozoyensis ATCC 20868]